MGYFLITWIITALALDFAALVSFPLKPNIAIILEAVGNSVAHIFSWGSLAWILIESNIETSKLWKRLCYGIPSLISTVICLVLLELPDTYKLQLVSPLSGCLIFSST